MSETVQALCLCGHGYANHFGPPPSGGPRRVCTGCSVYPGCYEWRHWDQRSERNEFAKAALIGLLASEADALDASPSPFAAKAFEYADAMLAEAKRRDLEPKPFDKGAKS